MPQSRPSDLFSLAGRVALVTGASGGIGLHLAGVLAARRAPLVEAAAARLGARAASVALDVSDETSVLAAVAQAETIFGVCDILINNAGIAVTKPFLEQTAADWDAVMGVDLRGAFLVAREVARRLIAQQRPGSIVNVTSILGARTIGGVASYAAAKAGLDHLTRVMALELARHRIRVNALAPGYIDSDINRGHFDSEAGRAMLRRVPQRRLGTLAELTGPLLLLASDAGSHMTGGVLVVDGGHSISPL
jgi:NAD(P)-dependent dehydrogenase (short-subunit alcohol dehydrogenase family)